MAVLGVCTRNLISTVVIPVVLAFAGCVRVPDQNLVVSRRGNLGGVYAADTCDNPKPMPSPAASSALDSDGFSLLNWNVLKGKRENWGTDFQRFGGNKDLLIIQEAYLTDEMQNLLQKMHYNWDMAATFEYRQIKAGVMTASKIEPNAVCILSNREPLIKIPKTVLVTRYPLSGKNQLLLVANVHLINFTLTASHFSAQLQQLERVLSTHNGPLIVSGDFNTWSDARMAIVNAAVNRLNLKAVTLEEDSRATIFGHNVDHIYYRGLELIEADATEVTTSDHNPITARFRVADTP